MEKSLPGRRAEAKSVYLMTITNDAEAEINQGLLDNPPAIRCCAVAPSVGWLLAARTVQGTGRPQ
jgi:hypothetical protein